MPIIERINTKDRTRPIKGDLVGLFDQPKIRLAIALNDQIVIEIFNFLTGFDNTKIDIVKENERWDEDSRFRTNPITLSTRIDEYEAYIINIDEIRNHGQNALTEYFDNLRLNLEIISKLKIGDIFSISSSYPMCEHHALFIDLKKIKIVHIWVEKPNTPLFVNGQNGLTKRIDERQDNLLEVCMFRVINMSNVCNEDRKIFPKELRWLIYSE